MSTTTNIPDQVNRTAAKGVEDAMYGKIRTEQKAQTLNNQTAPAYGQQAGHAAEELKQNVQEKLLRADDHTSSSVQGYTQAVKVKGAEVSAEVSRNIQPQVDAVKENAAAIADQGKAKVNKATTQTSEAANNFQKEASAKTDQAVSQGKADVQDAKAQSAGYVEQVLATAQSYVEAGQARLGSAEPTDPAQAPGRIASTVQSAAGMVLDTAGRSIAYAQSALQPSNTNETKPITESVKEKAAPVVDKAASTAAGIQNAVRENAAPVMDSTKQQVAAINDALSGSTNPPKSSLESDLEATKGSLATSRPPEPTVEGAAQPYQDTTKPRIEKPEVSL